MYSEIPTETSKKISINRHSQKKKEKSKLKCNAKKNMLIIQEKAERGDRGTNRKLKQ